MAQYAAFGSTPLSTDQVTDEAVATSQPSEFTRGARAGTYGMGSSLRNAAGAVADAFNYDDFAARQYGEADRLSLRAQQTGPRVGSLDQLKQGGYSLRDMGDYAAGVIGGAGPSIGVGVGASLAARGAPLASLAAGTAAFTPLEAGDAVAKWRAANPDQQIDTQTALRLGGTGLVSAGLQSVVPAMVGGKIMGRGPASMPATSLRQAAGRNLAEIPMEGLTEGAGELVKQTGATPELSTDWGQVGENAIAGMIGGAPMAGVGAVGDYAHGNSRAVTGAVGRGVDAVKGAVSSATGSARDAASAAIDTTQETARNAWDGVADVAKAAYDGTVEGFKASDLGKTLGDRANTVRGWATEILEDPATPETVREGLRNAVTRAGDKVNQAYVWAAKQARDAQAALAKPKDEAETTPAETPSDVLRSLRTAPDDSVDKVIGDGFLGDAAEMAKATGDRAVELSQESVKKGAEFATKWGNDLLSRTGVSDETKAQVTEALRNIGDRASQVTIASAKKAADAAEGVKGRVKEFTARLADAVPKNTDTKKSEDYSGARKAVNDVLAKYRKDVPEAVFNDPETANMLADGLRQFVQIAAAPGRYDTIDKHWVRAQLGSLLGPRSTDILNEVFDAVGSSDPDAVARRYQALNDLDELNKSSGDLVNTLTSALPEGSPLASRQSTDAEVLMRWARGELTKGMPPEQAKFEDRRMKEYIQETYGEKSKAVLAALEQQATKGRDLQSKKALDQDDVDEYDGSVQIKDAEAPNTSYVGGNKSGKVLVTDPAVYRAKDKTGLEGSTERLIKKLKNDNPGADVRFVSITDKPELVDMIPSLKAKITSQKKALAEQYPGDADRQLAALEQFRDKMVAELKADGMGMVEIASNPNPDALTQAEIEAMRLDTERYGKADNPARLEVPDGPIFDAKRVASVMRGKINKERTWTEEDDRSDAHRLARAFSDGVAALMEKYGRFKVSPDTLIGTINGKDFFARDIKGLKKDAPSGRREFILQEDMTSQQMQAELDKLELEAERRETAGDEDLDRLYSRMQRLEREIERLSAQENAKDMADQIGQQNVDPANDNITKAGAALTERELQRPAQSGVANNKGPDTKPLIALAEKIRESSAPAREKIADRLQTLALNANMMGKKDLQALMDLRMASKVSEVSSTINELARKYADRIVTPKVTPPKQKAKPAEVEGSPDPKAVAAKKAAFLEKAASGDAVLIKELKASTDAKGLQRAVEALNEAGQEGPVLDAINDRLAQLVQDPDVAYGMGTKKYSLLSTQVHNELGRAGFAATHDSPVRHDGTFNWRKFIGSGKGDSGFGAGTYLSTGETVHTFYKKMSTMLAKETSPTYHVSVQALKAQLMNWDKPLSEQSGYVQRRLKAEGYTDEAMTGAQIYKAMSKALGGDAAASDRLQEIGLVGHEYSAANGKDGNGSAARAPNYVIYDDSKIETNYVHFSAQRAAGAGMSAKGQRQVMDAIQTMLGNSVKVEVKNLPHAGEFEQVGADDVIRVSVHALNPTTVAYHASLHAFFAKLMRQGSGDIADVLMRATQRPAVNKRLRELLAGEPAALKQLRDPEERAAYMFQFWADGDAQLIAALKGQPQTFLQRIADTLRKVLGIWSNEDRALHIMEAFSSGEFAQNLGNPGAFRRAVMDPGRNKALEAARSLTKPFAELGEAVVAAGSARLRESRIPSLVELADTVKAPLTEETADPGYLPAARLERTRVLNALGAKLADLDKETVAEALEILQTGNTQGTTPEARLAVREVRKVLADQLAYLRAAGVDVGNLGPDYFPRVYDATYISKHQTEFQAVLDKHGVQGDTMHKIIANGGSELGVEVDRPGLQAKKRRSLDMIPDAELAPFMQKDLYQILNTYVTQSTRRAEWARRFGDDSTRLHELLAKAKKEGATDAQIDAAEKYVKGVNGTLGDDINPTARRLMGDMIVYQNIRLLPLAIFSSVVDPMGVLVRGGEVKDAWNTFKRGIREIPKGLRGDTSLDESARIADALGVIDNAALVHDLGALYSQGMVGDTARKINDTFFRFNLMEQFNRSMRVGATEAALKFMERHSTGTANAHSARWMRELGLMRGDVKVVNGRVALTQADGLTTAQEARIRTAVNRWVDGAVLRPDAADKPIWMNDPHWALVAHLKQFVYAFHHTILKRVGHEMRNGNYVPAMALASYVPIMIAADAAKGMLQNGGDEPEWKKNWGLEDYVAHGVQRAGLLGVGQLGVDAYVDVQRGGTGVGALAGPTLEQMGDALQVLGGHKQFESFALRAMPANALYSGYLDEERADLSTD
jgi:hypothetical protein